MFPSKSLLIMAAINCCVVSVGIFIASIAFLDLLGYIY